MIFTSLSVYDSFKVMPSIRSTTAQSTACYDDYREQLLVVSVGMEVLAENLIGAEAVRHLLYGKITHLCI